MKTIFSYEKRTGRCYGTGLRLYGIRPNPEVISENQKKLEARYGEQFTIDQSEVRAMEIFN